MTTCTSSLSPFYTCRATSLVPWKVLVGHTTWSARTSRMATIQSDGSRVNNPMVGQERESTGGQTEILSKRNPTSGRTGNRGRKCESESHGVRPKLRSKNLAVHSQFCVIEIINQIGINNRASIQYIEQSKSQFNWDMFTWFNCNIFYLKYIVRSLQSAAISAINPQLFNTRTKRLGLTMMANGNCINTIPIVKSYIS